MFSENQTPIAPGNEVEALGVPLKQAFSEAPWEDGMWKIVLAWSCISQVPKSLSLKPGLERVQLGFQQSQAQGQGPELPFQVVVQHSAN